MSLPLPTKEKKQGEPCPNEKKPPAFFAEFRKFVARGNVMDLAVGVIIGGAFSKITTSLVNDIIMPGFSVLLGGINFSDWKWVLKPATDTTEAITINYGAFLSAVLDFFILAFVIFCMMKAINTLHDRMVKKAEATPPPPPPEPSAEEKLLAEIRDLLKEQQKK